MNSHSKFPHKVWAVHDAKARFSEMLEATLTEGPQIVTKRGVETAVLVPIQEWRQLNAKPRRSLKELLLTDEARFDLDMPRIQFQPRVPDFDD